jgi:hypothetical protein
MDCRRNEPPFSCRGRSQLRNPARCAPHFTPNRAWQRGQRGPAPCTESLASVDFEFHFFLLSCPRTQTEPGHQQAHWKCRCFPSLDHPQFLRFFSPSPPGYTFTRDSEAARESMEPQLSPLRKPWSSMLIGRHRQNPLTEVCDNLDNGPTRRGDATCCWLLSTLPPTRLVTEARIRPCDRSHEPGL